MSYNKKLVSTAVCIALGVLLPMIFHLSGFMGPVFLPMHIPVLLAGLFLGAKSGMATGLAAPILSSLLTGMPPLMPTLPVMSVELMTYGFVSGYLYQQKKLPLLAALVLAMLAGRLVAAASVYALVQFIQLKMKPLVYLYGAFVTGLPGMLIQVVMIPPLVKKLTHKLG